jgi:hypothetical protein
MPDEFRHPGPDRREDRRAAHEGLRHHRRGMALVGRRVEERMRSGQQLQAAFTITTQIPLVVSRDRHEFDAQFFRPQGGALELAIDQRSDLAVDVEAHRPGDHVEAQPLEPFLSS